MKSEIINWLLEGPAWIRYATQLQLLGTKGELKPVLDDSGIKRIVQHLKNPEVGFPALHSHKITCDQEATVFWDLFFLADVGLTAHDLNLEKDLEDIFSRQEQNGGFILEARTLTDYFCVSGIILSSMARMGYHDDQRMLKYIGFMLDLQRPDGGWHCTEELATGNKPVEGISCPMDDLNALMLLSQYDKYRKDNRLNGAINMLLEHWERREENWRVDDFSIGKRFKALQYPATKYGILRVLDVLSFFPYAVRSRGFLSMLDYVHQKSSDGRYFAEPGDASYAEYDFGQDKEPSRWITFLVNRIEKRTGEHR
jgi:hypothetical protein